MFKDDTQQTTIQCLFIIINLLYGVCVCVYERERKRERD